MFTAVAVLSLALGIGANTAIFTLLDQILLRLMPVKDPQSLVLLTMRGRHYGSNWGGNAISYPMYRDFQDHNQVFSGMFCRRPYLDQRHFRRTDRARRGRNGFRDVFSGAGRGRGDRANASRPMTIEMPERPSAGGAELRLLEDALRGRSADPRQERRRERTQHDHHRRRAARIRRRRAGIYAEIFHPDHDAAYARFGDSERDAEQIAASAG